MLRPFVQLLKAIFSAICRVEGGLAGKRHCLQSFEELLLDCHGSDTVLLTVCFLHQSLPSGSHSSDTVLLTVCFLHQSLPSGSHSSDTVLLTVCLLHQSLPSGSHSSGLHKCHCRLQPRKVTIQRSLFSVCVCVCVCVFVYIDIDMDRDT